MIIEWVTWSQQGCDLSSDHSNSGAYVFFHQALTASIPYKADCGIRKVTQETWLNNDYDGRQYMLWLANRHQSPGVELITFTRILSYAPIANKQGSPCPGLALFLRIPRNMYLGTCTLPRSPLSCQCIPLHWWHLRPYLPKLSHPLLLLKRQDLTGQLIFLEFLRNTCFRGQSPPWKGGLHIARSRLILYFLSLSIIISDCLYSITSLIKKRKRNLTRWLTIFALIIVTNLNVWTLSVGIMFTL